MSLNSITGKVLDFIRYIVYHLEPHWDEFTGGLFFRYFGCKMHPGVERAKIVTRKGGIKTTRKDQLIVGLGQGDFDEHGGENNELCSADLVARHLGIENDPKVKLLLDKVRLGDRQGKSFPLDLGQCIRMLNHVGWSPARIETWYRVFLDLYFDDKTVIKTKGMETPANQIEFPVSNSEIRSLISAGTIFNVWLKKARKGKFKNQLKECLSQLKKDLAANAKHEPSKMFDLIECASLIAAYHPDDPDIVRNWVEPIFWACLEFQTDFLSACEIIKNGQTRVIKPYPNCHPYEIIQILAIDRQTNKLANRRLASAAKMLNRNLDILIIQQPTGNTQIMVLRNNRYGLLPMIARAIRLEEMIASGMEIDDININFDLLASTGRIDLSPRWYMPINDQGEGYALFNGALTIPDVSSTLIMLDRIVDIISQTVLMTDCSEDWYRYACPRLDRYADKMRRARFGNRLGDIAKITN